MWQRIRRPLQVSTVVAIVLVLAFGSRVAWWLKPSRRVAITIVDKTVPFRNYREHSFIPWLLRALKVTDPAGQFVDESRDYVGYDPAARVGHDLAAHHLAHADVLFLADTYGVYRGDYERPGDVAALERSPRIYGGFAPGEAAVIEDFSAKGGLVLGEFNSFASPTEAVARATLEQTFGVRWTHWVGRYWADIQSAEEVPRWVGRVYEHVYAKPLTITGAAFVFVRDDEDMIVLEAGKHLGESVIDLVRTAEAPDLGGLPERSSYWYWLDVVERTDADVIYDHVLSLTPAGQALLAEHQVPGRFPALTRRRGRPTYYFAGDFVDSGVERPPAESLGTIWWRQITVGRTGSPDERFLWNWYTPVLERLLEPRMHR